MILAALSLWLAHPTPAFAMRGGTPVSQKSELEATTVALTFVTDQGMLGLCSGSLIAEDLVLTAAHCLEGYEPTVVFGTDIDNPDYAVQADAMLTPKDYKESTRQRNRHDIGLVRFRGGLPAGFHPAKLLTEDRDVHFFERVTVAGFGSNEAFHTRHHRTGILRTARLRVISGGHDATEVMLHQKTRASVCPGDSGGPAFVEQNGELLLWGVTNTIGGIPTPWNRCLSVATYANVASPELRKWIDAASVEIRNAY